ncbi:MAG: Metal dependent phosphohydrolase [Parcubacteria group bacterium GW2011_GWD2_42_14]|nr:MAG: Metal dependent phosphohydrolase [Parcubacteria group bacterium GW2011_GWD2_42_14]
MPLWQKVYRSCLPVRSLGAEEGNGRILAIHKNTRINASIFFLLALPSLLCYTTSMTPLESLLQFVRFTHLTHKVERVARIPGETRYANTVEHSYQLTLLAWYLIEKENLHLDKDLVIKYALVHDLVETYAGDTYAHGTEGKENKALREHEAQERMASEFPEFKDLHAYIEAYELKQDPESRFVYALDKLIDPVNIYLEDGKLWHEKNVTLQEVLDYKTEKIAVDATVAKYFEELVVLLRKKENTLFPKN